MAWTITSFALIGITTSVVPSGGNATLSSTLPFLELDDSGTGNFSWRMFNTGKKLQFAWSTTPGSGYVTVGQFTDPTASPAWWNLIGTGVQITSLPVAVQEVYQQFVVSEGNPRLQWDTNGKIDWGPGGGTAVDTSLQRTAVGVLSTATIRATSTPSNVADLTRKDYVDTGDAARVAKAGDTMTGLLILSGDPAANLGAATKQYVDNKIPSGGAAGGGPFANNAVLVGQGTNTIATDAANFTWDLVNHRLGLGNNTPATLLDIANSTITLRQTGGNYSLTWANPAAARAISIPDPGGTDVFVFAAMVQGLTNKTYNGLTLTATTGTFTLTNAKTLTVQNTITLAGTDGTTITFQGTDTYVGRATTDTLTNKTINSVILTGTIQTPNLVALGGGAAPTFGTIGGSGPATAAQNGWLQLKDAGGVSYWVPAWK